MSSSEIIDKLDNIINHTRQSSKVRNDSEAFVREVLRKAKEARIHEVLPSEHIEALGAEAYLKPLARGRSDYPMNIIEVAAQRRNHKLILKLLRHPDDNVRIFAAENFQMLFPMLDGYYDEASALINTTLLIPTEIPPVKYALLRDLGRTPKRRLPREIADTARRLIHDPDEGVSYNALRVLSYLTDVRDWKTVLDRMLSLVGEESDVAQYFLAAGVEYLSPIAEFEPQIVEWMKSLVETYPPDHMSVQAVGVFVHREPDVALSGGLIGRKEYREIKGE
ncbi:MAG: hypothetical protein KF726_13225 [Anaerolineae bacterium]|nr:hypothetical protein [Anaerolineae bacterium]